MLAVAHIVGRFAREWNGLRSNHRHVHGTTGVLRDSKEACGTDTDSSGGPRDSAWIVRKGAVKPQESVLLGGVFMLLTAECRDFVDL